MKIASNPYSNPIYIPLYLRTPKLTLPETKYTSLQHRRRHFPSSGDPGCNGLTCILGLCLFISDICVTAIRLLIAADMYVTGTEPDYSGIVSAFSATGEMSTLGSINDSQSQLQTKRKRVSVSYVIVTFKFQTGLRSFQQKGANVSLNVCSAERPLH